MPQRTLAASSRVERTGPTELRFGVKEGAVYEYFKAIGAESGLDIIVHVYPANTKASYSTRLMLRLAGLPQVKGFKMGERDLGKY